MKKLLAGILAAALVFAACISLAACGASYSETYTGYVSEYSYGTADAAVRGFLQREISGSTFTATYVSYTKEKDLTEKEIQKLGLDGGYSSVEKGTVEYTENSVSSSVPGVSAASASASAAVSKTVYILGCQSDGTLVYRYFAPALKKGETLTSSYYNSVFDAESYVNCTAEFSASVESAAEGYSSVVSASGVCKLTSSALYENVTASETYNGEEETETTEAYCLISNNALYYVSSTNGGAYSALPIYTTWNDYSDGFLTDMVTEYYGEYDHTYFEKTSTGFALREDKYAEIMRGVAGSSAFEGVVYSFDVNVTEGRIADITVSFKVEYAGYTVKILQTLKYYDYGVTEVDIPDEVKSALS